MALRYQFYGLVVQSDHPLGPSRESAALRLRSRPDLEFVRGAAEEFSAVRRALQLGVRANGQEPWFRRWHLSDGREYLRWPRLFEFLIARDGRRIAGRPLREISRETFQTYLFGQVLSFALLKLGLEPLHATTVVKDGAAVGFLGDSGTGKSTLAAACLTQGWRLVTDDQLVLSEDGPETLAQPGPPRLKLMPSIAKRLFGPPSEGCPVNPLTSKRIIPLAEERVARSPVPLHAIYVLRSREATDGSRIVIRRVPTKKAWYELTRGTFNPVVQEPERLARQFAWASRLARRVPVYTLSYPRTLRALPCLVEAVAAHRSSP